MPILKNKWDMNQLGLVILVDQFREKGQVLDLKDLVSLSIKDSNNTPHWTTLAQILNAIANESYVKMHRPLRLSPNANKSSIAPSIRIMATPPMSVKKSKMKLSFSSDRGIWKNSSKVIKKEIAELMTVQVEASQIVKGW